MLRVISVTALLGVIPLIWVALRYLASRDYAAGAIVVVAAAAVGHLGLELVALTQAREDT